MTGGLLLLQAIAVVAFICLAAVPIIVTPLLKAYKGDPKVSNSTHTAVSGLILHCTVTNAACH